MLGSKSERLPDNPSKPDCSFEISGMSALVGNFVEQKRLLTHALKRGVKTWLSKLTHADRQLDLRARGWNK